MRREFGGFQAGLGLLVVAALASVAIVAAATTTRGRLDGDVGDHDTTVDVVSQVSDGAFTAVVVLSSLQVQSIVVHADGVVTGLGLQPGQTSPVEGDTALVVDDLPMVAQYGAAPIGQDVGSDSPPAAIERVQSFLARIGLFDGDVDGVWENDTAEAVERFVEEQGRPDRGVFPAAAVLWLGADRGEIHQLELEVGAVVSDGQSVGGVGVVSADVQVRPPGGQVLDDRTGWVLEVNDQTVPIMTDFEVPESSVASLAGMLEVEVETPGLIRREEPVETTLVPAATIVSDGERTCVITPDDDAVDVAVTRSGLDGVGVAFDGPPPAQILLDPPAGSTCR